MFKAISKKLDEIEQAEDIRIIHCVESGSRAWGFPSPDSDYDVRFIYVRPLEHYLKLEKTDDVIEWQLDDVFDINGWDIQKTLRLLHKSNPTIFEWNSSPIIYKTTEDWEKISNAINGYFNTKSGLYHYLSTAKKNYFEYLQDDFVKLKKYFYVLRPILACKWILSEGTPPPMLFTELADKYLDESIKSDVEHLLFVKMNTPEFGMGKKIESINSYIEENIDILQESINRLPAEPMRSWDKLDAIFLSLIKS